MGQGSFSWLEYGWKTNQVVHMLGKLEFDLRCCHQMFGKCIYVFIKIQHTEMIQIFSIYQHVARLICNIDQANSDMLFLNKRVSQYTYISSINLFAHIYIFFFLFISFSRVHIQTPVETAKKQKSTQLVNQYSSRT